MESLQIIKNRIQSIESTRQITQSMRLVATAKMQKARNRMNGNLPFLGRSQELIAAAAWDCAGLRHPYLTEREGGRAAIVVIAGDRGLCGGYNINACRKAAELIKSNHDARIITIGQKARDYCRRRYRSAVEQSYTGMSENPFYEDIRAIAGQLTDWYSSGEVNRVYVVYTQFETMLLQTPIIKRILPLEIPPQPEKDAPGPLTRCEPSGEELLNIAMPFYLSSFIYGAILESSACEQSFRITSMDSAVKSADEMIESLTLMHNRARQTAITQEIVEVVGGANVS